MGTIDTSMTPAKGFEDVAKGRPYNVGATQLVLAIVAIVTTAAHTVADFKCGTCDKSFGSQQAVGQHMNALGHWWESASSSSDGFEHYCDYDDYTEVSRAENELRSPEVHEHSYCVSCDRFFADENTINMGHQGAICC